MYRLGGEEFLVLLPGSGLDEAAEIAERMRAAVAARPAEGVPVSVSFGVSAADGDDIELDRMLEAADGALLAAKRTGRDRVVRRPMGSARLGELSPHEPVPHPV
jgi:diguanylate cyclase (GGDEF)-like protein